MKKVSMFHYVLKYTNRNGEVAYIRNQPQAFTTLDIKKAYGFYQPEQAHQFLNRHANDFETGMVFEVVPTLTIVERLKEKNWERKGGFWCECNTEFSSRSDTAYFQDTFTVCVFCEKRMR